MKEQSKSVKAWGIKNKDGKIVMSLFKTRRETQAFIFHWNFNNCKVVRVLITEVTK